MNFFIRECDVAAVCELLSNFINAFRNCKVLRKEEIVTWSDILSDSNEEFALQGIGKLKCYDGQDILKL